MERTARPVGPPCGSRGIVSDVTADTRSGDLLRLSALGRGVFCLCVALLLGSCDRAAPNQPAKQEPAQSAITAADHVGRDVCAECHPDSLTEFTRSDHDLAMQEPTSQTVRGDFSGATFVKDGETVTFVRGDGEFRIRTETAGVAREYPVHYVFGHDPIEQYLVATDSGRLQSVTVAWDSREADRGGQRWFTLYPDETVPPGDSLHWLGPQQNWNHMCADCHSTALRKNYHADTDRFTTEFEELDVSCEACHGAGSRHVAWARSGAASDSEDKGLEVHFRQGEGAWQFEPGQPTASRTQPLDSAAEVETCGRCHSRRLTVDDAPPRGRALADTHRVALLDASLYFADGQIDDEVFVYGSFLQSKMHAAGVRCTDCHDPHTAKVVAPGNALCAKCHQPSAFDTPEHHHHPTGSAGASCVNCHMPERTYMVIDPRRDHSMRVPRPDLSEELGVPNSCNGCHRDKSNAWASAAVRTWYGGATESRDHFARALHAGARGTDGSGRMLEALIVDHNMPAIARATAVTLLRHPFTDTGMIVIQAAAGDADPLVRRAAAEQLNGLPMAQALRTGATLLGDGALTVRMAAASTLASLPPDAIDAEFGRRLRHAQNEVRAASSLHLDRAEICHNLGNLELAIGNLDTAEQLFRRALDRDASFVAARVNLADTLRAKGDDTQAVTELRTALRDASGAAEVHYALGLALVRTRDMPTALLHLKEAVGRQPGSVQYSFVYAVALHDSGQPDQAIEFLIEVSTRRPDPQLIGTLVQYLYTSGRSDEARSWAEKLPR